MAVESLVSMFSVIEQTLYQKARYDLYSITGCEMPDKYLVKATIDSFTKSKQFIRLRYSETDG